MTEQQQEQQQTSIFRKQSIDSVSSPEQLNDYIRAASPGVWFVMFGVIFLLIGICVWGIFGRVDTRVQTGAVCKGGTLTVFVPEKYEDRLRDGMTVIVNDKNYTITDISDKLIQLTDEHDPYALHKGNLSAGDFGFTVTAQAADVPDGAYKATLIIESVAPMSFIIN